MKKILSILTVLVLGFYFLSGVGMAAQIPGATLSFQKQLESREPENHEKLQFWWIWVNVTEIYGTVEDPQYRPLANVTIEIKASFFGFLFWSNFWSGKTDKDGMAKVSIIDSLCYKVTVTKDGYHTYGCLPFKIIITGDQFRYYANFIMAEDGSPFVKQITDSQQSFIMPSGQESELKNEELNFFLSLYGIGTEDTMGEFEQVLYNLVSKRWWRYPRLVSKLMNDIDKLSEILEQIGVKDDMTIAEALPIIKSNKEQLKEEGINLFCSIDMHAYDGGTFPLIRYYKAIIGWWTMGPIWTDDYATIKGIIGLQHCDYPDCEDNTEGRFIFLIGNDPPVIGYAFELTCQPAWVKGFVLFSKSDVPFVESNGGSQQTQCPCIQ